MLPLKDRSHWNRRLRLRSAHDGHHMTLNQQAKKEIVPLRGYIFLTIRENGLLLHNEGQQNYVWNAEILTSDLFLLNLNKACSLKDDTCVFCFFSFNHLLSIQFAKYRT